MKPDTPEPGLIEEALPFSVVGVGASAGGLEAYRQMLAALPVDTGMAFVLVQHLSPTRESALVEILQRETGLPVAEVSDGMEIEPDRVYINPPANNIAIDSGRFRLLPRLSGRAQQPINLFFRSLALAQGHRSLAVVLSGTASDGTLGLEEVKAAGGVTFAQDRSAQHGGMPESAQASGCVDFVLSPEAIAGEIARIARHPHFAQPDPDQRKSKEQLGAILDSLEAATGVDLRGYKTNTLFRRITRRMALHKCENLSDYAQSLRGDSKEAQALYQDVLINVTDFFRDTSTFEMLQSAVLKPLLKGRSRQDPLRIWTAGCSTGEEAYSLAIALSELCEGPAPAQIFATDLNAESIGYARAGIYLETRLQSVSCERLGRFFVEVNEGFQVSKALREMCIFSTHNLLSDPPFSRIDLVTCRNLLIYLTPKIQERLISLFHFALKADRFLLLGCSESAGADSALFQTVDKGHRIFARKAGPSRVPVGTFPSRSAVESVSLQTRAPLASPAQGDARREVQKMLLHYAPPAVMVNELGEILEFRGDTEAYLSPPHGKASLNLMRMARAELVGPLRALLHRAKRECGPMEQQSIQVKRPSGDRLVDLEVRPVAGHPYFLVLFKPSMLPPPDASLNHAARDELVLRLEHDLLSSREYLQSMMEQHEAALEELQASNEEGQSANEELQSMNEELQTSKEEIEATSEELATVNDELTHRNLELGKVNSDLINLIGNIHFAVVIVSRDRRIQRISSSAETLLRILPSDVGRPMNDFRCIADLDLNPLLEEVFKAAGPQEREIQCADGRWYCLNVRPYLTLDNRIDGAVFSLVDIDAIRRSREFAENIVTTVRQPLLVLDPDLRVLMANRAFREQFGGSQAEVEGRHFFSLANGRWDIPPLRQILSESGLESGVRDVGLKHDFSGLGGRSLVVNARRFLGTDALKNCILLSLEDVTESLQTQEVTKISEIRYRRLFETAPDGILLLDPGSGQVQAANPLLERLLGHSNLELQHKQLWEVGLFPNAAESQRVIQELREKAYVRYDNLSLQTRAGERLEVEFMANLYQEGENSVIQCNIRDITERRLLESALAKQAEELASVDTAKSHFIAVLSHELRSPLAAICGWTQILLGGEVSPEDLATGLEVIDRNSKKQARLIEDLLDTHRIAGGKVGLELSPQDLSSVLGAELNAIAPAAAKKPVQLHFEGRERAVQVSADLVRLHQILANLLGNALKFTPGGGEVRVQLDREGPWARISIRDTGVGISSDSIGHIFDAFRQADPAINRPRGGLGLGLSISKQLIELHGGSIEATSAGTGRGSCFTVLLPLLEDGEVRTPAVAERIATPPMTLAGLLILVVDDEPDAREPVRRFLEKAGAETLAVGSVTEALAALRQRLPDLIVSDIAMPEQDGYDLIRALRALPLRRGGKIPAIALTAYATQEDRERTLAAGFQDHLAKPVDGLELIAAVAQAIGEKQK